MRAQLAFYKGPGDITDKAIRWWTNSPYSHVEVVVDGIWTSTSPRTLKLASRRIEANPDHWDYLEVGITQGGFRELRERYTGCGYDWTGILLSQVMPIGVENPRKLFCSEWCAMVLDLEDPQAYSPGTLYDTVESALRVS